VRVRLRQPHNGAPAGATVTLPDAEAVHLLSVEAADVIGPDCNGETAALDVGCREITTPCRTQGKPPQ